MHSAGYGIWRTHAGGRIKSDPSKCSWIFKDLFGNDKKNYKYKASVLSLVSLAKQSAFDVDYPANEGDFHALIDHFNIDCPGDEEDLVIDMARKILSESNRQCTKRVDFDDMIYAPILFKATPLFKYDWVLIDEAQDTNFARRKLALLMLKEGGRLVAVGDRHQAIYGFTGADSNAMDLIKRDTTAAELPLSITYRCPKAVVKEAQKYVAHIQCAEAAPEGEVTKYPVGTNLTEIATPGDAILCRTNAPIISLVYDFIKKGIPAKVEGRDIGRGLIKVIEKWQVSTFGAFNMTLDEWERNEIEKLQEKNKTGLIENLQDKAYCIRLIAERVQETTPHSRHITEDIKAQIESLFDDNVGRGYVTLSTIHKSKGREWENVFWLKGPISKWAKKDWEFEAEDNLCYVAITRAISKLGIIPLKDS
jgi:superfamily I DNA/RNA helicase